MSRETVTDSPNGLITFCFTFPLGLTCFFVITFHTNSYQQIHCELVQNTRLTDSRENVEK